MMVMPISSTAIHQRNPRTLKADRLLPSTIALMPSPVSFQLVPAAAQ